MLFLQTQRLDWQAKRLPPIDIHLNVAVMHMASIVCPAEFDVSDKAPSTMAELTEFVETNGRIMVYSGASEKTIYADREVNYCFRAWHDWCHWKGRFDFSLKGETAVRRMQSDHLRLLYGDTAITRRWRKILYIEIVEQWLFNKRHGYFPDDQMSFTRSYLKKLATV